MKVYYGTYVKPVFVKHQIAGWTWELYENGKIIAFSDETHLTIDAARTQARTKQKELNGDG